MFKLPLLFLAMFICTASVAQAEDLNAPDAGLKGTVGQFLDNIKQHSAEYRNNKSAYYQMVDQVVAPRLDASGIAWFALGKFARAATPEQRQQFADRLTRNLVHSYGDFMLGNNGSMDVSWKAVHMEAGADRAMVHSMLTSETGTQYEVGFSMHRVDGDWKIYDLDIDGVSLELNYRTQLNSEIARTSLDAVIARMTQQGVQYSSASSR